MDVLAEVIRGLAMSNQTYTEVPLWTSQQKGTSESSHIYFIKHILRQNNVSLIIPVIEGGPWPSFVLSLQCEMC